MAYSDVLSIEDRVNLFADYMLENKTTVRAVAAYFGYSKSTVHKDVTERLMQIDSFMAKKLRVILDENKAQRHIRGGMATKKKYERIKRK